MIRAFYFAPSVLVATLSVLALFVPEVVSAQNPLVSCDGFVGNAGGDCNFCHFVEMINRIILWLVGVLFVIFAVLMVVAGFKLVTSGGNQAALDSAKSMLTNAIIGMIIVFAAWFIVDSIMKALLPKQNINGVEEAVIQGFGPWNQIKCTTQINPKATYLKGSGVDEVNYSDDTTAPPAGFQPGTLSPGQLDHDSALAALQAAGVTVTSTQGPNGVKQDCSGISRCTSLQRLNQDTVNQAVAIKKACPSCNVTVTGATEGGHAGGLESHANGYKIDIDDTPELDKFLVSKLTASGERTGAHGGLRYVDGCGNEYVRESSHWDISVTKGSCSI